MEAKENSSFEKVEEFTSTGIGSNVVDILEWVKSNFIE